MGDKDKKKDQAEGGKNIKENKTVSTLNDTLEKVFRDVALIDPKENVEGVIKEILRQVRAMKTELTAEEMAQLVFENMQPKSRDYMLAGLLTDIFAKYGEMKTRHTKNMDELSPDISKGVFPYLHNYDDALYKEELYETIKRNPQALVQLCLGAFKAGMREFTANVSGNDLVRVTGYMVRLSDLEKYRAEGSRTNTTWLGEEAARNTHILERQPRVVSHEQQMRFR